MLFRSDNTEVMEIHSGEDTVSLVTCTPYGLNTHRLVVTGIRVPYEKTEYDNIQENIPSAREILFVTLPIVFILVLIIFKIKDWRNRAI